MRIYIVDDNHDILETLKDMVEQLGHEVFTYSSSKHFVELSPDLALGCILLDYAMPGMDGLAVQKQLSALKCRHPIILLTGVGDIPEAVTAMREGAVDVLRKPITQAALSAALSRAQTKLDEAYMLMPLNSITPREREILQALANGQTSKEVALNFGISKSTVEAHRQSLMRKLRVSNISAALLLAQQGGLLRSSPAAEQDKAED